MRASLNLWYIFIRIIKRHEVKLKSAIDIHLVAHDSQLEDFIARSHFFSISTHRFIVISLRTCFDIFSFLLHFDVPRDLNARSRMCMRLRDGKSDHKQQSFLPLMALIILSFIAHHGWQCSLILFCVCVQRALIKSRWSKSSQKLRWRHSKRRWWKCRNIIDDIKINWCAVSFTLFCSVQTKSAYRFCIWWWQSRSINNRLSTPLLAVSIRRINIHTLYWDEREKWAIWGDFGFKNKIWDLNSV